MWTSPRPAGARAVAARRVARWLVGLAALLALAWVSRPREAAADDDFFSSSPGDLAQSHAALDTKERCADCHVNNGRELSNDKCLGCHDHADLAERIRANKGFHASINVRGKKCESCHAEHKGRGYDLMGWKSQKGGEKAFDHDLTGWPLRGKHAATACEDCHKTRDRQGLRTYLGQDRLCGSCHKKDQPHKFERKEMLACERCHGESVWKPAKALSQMQFDHDDRRDAAMPLLGSHKDVRCDKCHPKSLFNLPAAKPDGCGNQGCHESPHDGHLFGKKDCEWCHSPTFKTLKQQNFDHSEKTKFDLGAHNKLRCYDCHTKALGEAKPDAACEQCHAKSNHHGDRFAAFGSPPRCVLCHPTTSWKPTAFNHARGTKFPLTGKHAEVSCRGCHRGRGPADFEQFKSSLCMDCHQHRTVHDKKFTNDKCLGCHQGAGSMNFNHTQMVKDYHGPTSRFPLVKKHKNVPCADCHTGRDAKGKTTFTKISTQCGDTCHEDTLHKGSLTTDCNACHAPGQWEAVRFQHDEPFPDGGSFLLKGEHKNNKCESCHPTREYKGTPRTCAAEGCHAQDDAHKGRLGDQCQRCHLETRDNIFSHNTMSSFKLDGKHLTVRCNDCHPSVTFKPRPSNCFGCHPEPAVHKGQYGTGCETCHSTKTWEEIRPLHDVGDFSLKGAHDNLACERCHRDNRPMAGSGNLCINCHRQDDVHQNSLSPRCGECHTQWSFTPARFDHNRVGCSLTGLHRTLGCNDCHKAGNYSGLAATCASCHHDDALRAGQAGGVPHPTQVSCGGCHNPNAWRPATGTAAFGRDSVCR